MPRVTQVFMVRFWWTTVICLGGGECVGAAVVGADSPDGAFSLREQLRPNTEMLTPTKAPQYRKRIWRKEHGLPCDEVRSLFQTRDGYLWIGTREGLSRFDGLSFTTFSHLKTPVFVSNQCTALAEDAAGQLWVGTDAGLIVFSNSGARRLTRNDGLLSDHVVSLCATRNGELWIGTTRGLNRWRAGRIEVVPPPTGTMVSESIVEALSEDAAGFVWFSNLAGVRRWNPATDSVEVIRLPGAGAQSARHIQSSDSTGVWFLGTGLYLNRNGQTKLVLGQDFQPAAVSSLLVAKDGAIWMGGATGLHCLREDRLMVLNETSGLSMRSVTCLCEDREGNIWIGTEEGGLNCWSASQLNTYTSSEGLPDDHVWSVCPDRDGALWIGTSAGLGRWPAGQKFPAAFPLRLGNNTVRALHADKAGNLWIGAGNGLECLSGGELVKPTWPSASSNDVHVILADRAGDLWVGCESGLRVRRGRQWFQSEAKDGLPVDVRALAEVQDGSLWLGSHGGGLARVRWAAAPSPSLSAGSARSSETADARLPIEVLSISTTNGLLSDRIWALYVDADGVLWCGGEHGLNRIEFGRPSSSGSTVREQVSASPHITSFTAAHGFFDTVVNEILEDDLGYLWVSSDQAIYRLRKDELNALAAGRTNRIVTIAYDGVDGLPNGDLNGQRSKPAACKSPDGRLWFATSKGLVVLDPANLPANDTTLQVVIERVIADGEVLFDNDRAPAITLAGSGVIGTQQSHPTPMTSFSRPNSVNRTGAPADFNLGPGRARRLVIHFTATTFRAPQKVAFRFRLEGNDRDWIEGGSETTAVYTNLRPGFHRFEVSADPVSSRWSGSSAAFTFYLAPLVYQTVWFWSITGLSLIGGALALIIWRLREIHRLNEWQRQAELARERERIAHDMHDDLGAGLTRLVLLGQNAAHHVIDETTKPLLQRLTGEASMLMDNLGELVWATNSKFDNAENLMAHLREFAANFLTDAGLRFRLDFPSKVPAIKLSGPLRRDLFLSLKEILNNIVRHAEASEVTVTCHLHGSPGSGPPMIELIVSDNGRGMDSPLAETPRIERGRGRSGKSGLAGLRTRVQARGGLLELRTAPNQGTVLTLRIPIDSAEE